MRTYGLNLWRNVESVINNYSPHCVDLLIYSFPEESLYFKRENWPNFISDKIFFHIMCKNTCSIDR